MSTIINIKTSPGQHGYTLNALELSVHFHGAIDIKHAPEYIPAKLSIHLSDEWAAFLPVVHDVLEEKLATNKQLTPAMFPFLPLPCDFEHTDASHWQQLANQIERCLVDDPLLDSKHPECYCLMRELFWMAFVAAHPEFPQGRWPCWNALIPMEGAFISRWVSRDPDGCPDLNLHQVIWEQFRSIVADNLLPSSPE